MTAASSLDHTNANLQIDDVTLQSASARQQRAELAQQNDERMADTTTKLGDEWNDG